MPRIFDPIKPGRGRWPRWWENTENPDDFGTVCVICQQALTADGRGREQHNFSAGMDNDFISDSGFCVCTICVRRIGARPRYEGIDSHDRGMMQRFSAVYRTLKEEIKWQKKQSNRAYFPSASTLML